MADDVAKRDDNYRVNLMGVTDDANAFIKNLLVDPTTSRLKVSAVVGAVDATSIQGVTVDDTDIGDGKILKYNAVSGNLEYEVDASAGEANTASNVGTAGVGVFKQKTGVDLEFKKINAGSAKITVTDDVGDDEVDIDFGTVASTDLSDGGDLYKSGGTDVAIADGGTGASDAATARTNLGLGTIATQAANSVAITGGSITGITDLAIADGGTGASTAADAFTALKQAATTAATGVVELAIASEVNTGTDTSRAITPDALAGANIGIRYMQIVAFDFNTDVATGDGKFYVHIPAALNGMNLVEVHAEVITAGTTGTTDIQIANVTDTVDMLSTKITIDSGETGSDTAATPAVIDTNNDDVATNDLLRIDVDAVSTTAPKGLIVTMGFQLP